MEDAKQRARLMLSLLKESYLIDSNQIFISASIGISLLDQHSLDAHAFIKEADAAMYEVKSQGRDGAILFDEELSQKLQNHIAIEQRLHFALKNREIFLNFQPQYDAKRNIVGCEVLVRWINKELGFVSPDKFITIAEQTGIMIPLGKYILEESLKTLMDWYLLGIRLKKFSINISPRELFDHNFVEETIRICRLHLDAQLCSLLVFEITETHLIDDVSKVTKIIQELKDALGVRFSIDDFGTGYSSLSYIQKLPIDELKIDKSFVDEIETNINSQNMLHVIFTMADAFHLTLVAEGVETQTQYNYLVNEKEITLQGYLFSKPLSRKDFETLYFESVTTL
jgi:EAL domain-containing protein (putative c-di-GMP-specific phosphodiesterase class I)